MDNKLEKYPRNSSTVENYEAQGRMAEELLELSFKSCEMGQSCSCGNTYFFIIILKSFGPKLGCFNESWMPVWTAGNGWEILEVKMTPCIVGARNSFAFVTITMDRLGDFIWPKNCEISNQGGNIFCLSEGCLYRWKPLKKCSNTFDGWNEQSSMTQCKI